MRHRDDSRRTSRAVRRRETREAPVAQLTVNDPLDEPDLVAIYVEPRVRLYAAGPLTLMNGLLVISISPSRWSIRRPAVFIRANRYARQSPPFHRSQHPRSQGFGAGNLREVERHLQLDIAQDVARRSIGRNNIRSRPFRRRISRTISDVRTAPIERAVKGWISTHPPAHIGARDIAIGPKCPTAASPAGSTLLAHPTCCSGSLHGFGLAQARQGSLSTLQSLNPAGPVPLKKRF
jgi:hypothetical protein